MPQQRRKREPPPEDPTALAGELGLADESGVTLLTMAGV